MNELQIQKHLCDAAIAEGGYGYKTSHQFLVGIADLDMQLRGLPNVKIEVKWAPKLSRRGNIHFTRAELTPHQIRFIDRIQEAGGKAGFAVAVGLDQPGRVAFYASSDTKLCTNTTLCFDDTWIIRERGAPWPIRQIVNRILG